MIPLLAIASNWVYVGKASNSNTFFIDNQSISRSGDSVTFWVKTNYASRDSYGDLSSKINQTINCRTRELIHRYFMFYDDLDNKGKLTISTAPPSPTWEPIAPDTVNELLLKFVCR